MAIFKCPKCGDGKMDGDKGEKGTCWYCSLPKNVYVCDSKKVAPAVFGQDPLPTAETPEERAARGNMSAGPLLACGLKICASCLGKVSEQQKKPKAAIPFRKGPPIAGGDI